MKANLFDFFLSPSASFLDVEKLNKNKKLTQKLNISFNDHEKKKNVKESLNINCNCK